MDSNMTVTVYDSTTKKSKNLAIHCDSRLSQVRQQIEKQWNIKDFRFINESGMCIKGTQKHIPLQMYLKAYNTILITSERQQPKKQSKIIEKPPKRKVMICHSMASEEQIVKSGQANIIDQKHFRWTKQNIEYCKWRYNIELSEDGYGLDHDHTQINMSEFTRYDWTKVQWLSLYGCNIDDDQWRMLVQKAGMFSRVKVIGIKDNKISTIKDGDLQKFKSLQLIEFGTNDGVNPLSKESKKYLKSFRQLHPQIKVRFKN